MMKRIRLRLRSLFNRGQLDRDLEAELSFHMEMLARDHSNPRRQFGNYSGLKEACREMWTLGRIELVWQDVRYGFRSLVRNGGLTSVAVAALALGIGVNAAVFTLVNAVLFKNLPFAHSDRILYLSSANRQNGVPIRVSYPDYMDFRAQATSFDAMGASAGCAGDVSDASGFAQNFVCSQISANGFTVLGQRPFAGRDFTPADEVPGAPPVAMLSYGLWESRYGKDPAAIGKMIRVNAVATTVVGVMPAGLRFPMETELWLPLTAAGDDRAHRTLSVFGHLAEGANRPLAQVEMTAIAGRLATQYPATNQGIVALVQDFNSMALRRKLRSVFLMLLAAVGLVLMIACANVANLLLAKAVGRAREVSIRAALGAGRWRVIRQLLIESVMLSGAGGVCGWFLAMWGARVFDVAVIPTGKPAWIDFSLDYRVLLYTSAVSIGTGLLFGLAPALRLSRFDFGTALKEGGRGAAGPRARYLSSVLVVVEMALAVVLLAGAGLMLRGYLMLLHTPVGVNTAGVLTMKLDLPNTRYAHADDQVAFYRRLKARLSAMPEIEAADLLSDMPTDGAISFAYEIAGVPATDARERPHVGGLVVGPDYFRMMQAPPVAGRAFTDADGAAVAMVNQSFVNRFWPRQNPLGKQLRIIVANVPHTWLTVVGVAPDIGQSNADFLQRDPLLYLPYRQEPRPAMFVAARTRVPPGSMGEAFRRAVQSVDPDLPVRNLMTLEDHMATQYRLLTVFGGMFVIFAAIAVLLAAVGLYAVISHSVSQRTQEIGVRLALGATQAGVLRLVMGQGMRQLGVGLIFGLAGAFALTRALNELLVGVSATDPLTFASVSAVLVVAGLLGCAVPARRAVRVDPAVTLRHD